MMNRLTIIFVLMIAIAAACSDGDNLSPEEGNPTTDTIPPPPCAEAVDSLACIHQLKFDSLVSAQALLRDSLLEIGWIPFFGFECKGPFAWNEPIAIGKRPAVLIPPDTRFNVLCGLPLHGPAFYYGEGSLYGLNPCIDDAQPENCRKGLTILSELSAPIIFEMDTIAVLEDIGSLNRSFRFYAKYEETEGLFYFFVIGSSESTAKESFSIAYSFYLYDDPDS